VDKKNKFKNRKTIWFEYKILLGSATELVNFKNFLYFSKKVYLKRQRFLTLILIKFTRYYFMLQWGSIL